ncbi:hypothetical protein DIPPA_02565, partial [Diplonema papillatum]
SGEEARGWFGKGRGHDERSTHGGGAARRSRGARAGGVALLRGGPLPAWDEVYEVHCGVEVDVIDERPDLECGLLSFANGNKYWYPARVLIMGNSDEAPGTRKSSTASTLPLLSNDAKHRIIEWTRRFFADPSVRLESEPLILNSGNHPSRFSLPFSFTL